MIARGPRPLNWRYPLADELVLSPILKGWLDKKEGKDQKEPMMTPPTKQGSYNGLPSGLPRKEDEDTETPDLTLENDDNSDNKGSEPLSGIDQYLQDDEQSDDGGYDESPPEEGLDLQDDSQEEAQQPEDSNEEWPWDDNGMQEQGDLPPPDSSWETGEAPNQLNQPLRQQPVQPFPNEALMGMMGQNDIGALPGQPQNPSFNLDEFLGTSQSGTLIPKDPYHPDAANLSHEDHNEAASLHDEKYKQALADALAHKQQAEIHREMSMDAKSPLHRFVGRAIEDPAMHEQLMGLLEADRQGPKPGMVDTRTGEQTGPQTAIGQAAKNPAQATQEMPPESQAQGNMPPPEQPKQGEEVKEKNENGEIQHEGKKENNISGESQDKTEVNKDKEIASGQETDKQSAELDDDNDEEEDGQEMSSDDVETDEDLERAIDVMIADILSKK